jgi:hypothetical protein
MAFRFVDRVQETTTSLGTGSVALAGAVLGFRTFNSAIASGDTCYYTITDAATGDWEVGIGTFTAPSTLARTTVQVSSNAGALVNLSAYIKTVSITVSGAGFAGFCPVAGPGAAQAFSVGALTAGSVRSTGASNAVGSQTLDITAAGGLVIMTASNDRATIQAYNGNATGYRPLTMQESGGVVLVGTTLDNASGAKLQVSGQLSTQATGNNWTDSGLKLRSVGGAYTTSFLSASGWLEISVNGTNNALAITPSNSLLVNAETDNGSGAKLQVEGSITSSGNITTGAGGAIVTQWSSTPANSSVSGPRGQISYDSNYMYMWVGVNSVKRVALSSF